MKRKRFIKLLMARGYSRNDAAQAALNVSSNGNTFRGVYFAVLVNDGDPVAVEAVQAACERIIKVISALSSAAVEAAKKIAEGMPSAVGMAQKIMDLQDAATE